MCVDYAKDGISNLILQLNATCHDDIIVLLGYYIIYVTIYVGTELVLNI